MIEIERAVKVEPTTAMMVAELTAEHPGCRVAQLTTWATSDVSGLLSEFYASHLLRGTCGRIQRGPVV